MVRRLAWLKWRLIWNGLRKDWQRRIGFPGAIAFLTWVAGRAAGYYLGVFRDLSPEGAAEFSLWAALALFVAWVSLPVVIFPLDENLDPDQFALAPVPPVKLIIGLGVSALIAPSVTIPLVTMGANVYSFASVWPAALLGAALMVVLLIVSGQLFTTVISAVLHGRRGRDLAILLVAGIGLFGFASQQVVRGEIARRGIGGAVAAHPLQGWAEWLPPVAAQRVVTEAAAGDWTAMVGAAGATVIWIVLFGWAWRRLLGWILVTPKEVGSPARRRAGVGLAGGRWWNPRAVMARKEWRFFLRDPRQRLVWTGAVIFLGLGGASILVGSGGLMVFFDREWLPLVAPVLVLFVGLPIALNMFGWERNAASFLFVLPARPRTLMVGKNLAVAAALALETAVMGVILAALSDSWAILRYLPALGVCAIGCQLAIGNLTSVLTPLRLPREGTDVFAQATEQGCLAIAAQLGSFFTIGLLLVIPASVTVLTVGFGQALSPWISQSFALAWGIGLYLVSLWLAGGILARRVPEVVNWVQVV